jgi:hypothetical protein
MAIALGAVTTAESAAGSDTLTYSSPNISGSNTILFVAVYGSRVSSITGVTHNGTAMTSCGTGSSIEANRKLQMFYRVAPTAGVSDIVCTISGADGARVINSAAVYYTGAKQTGVPDAYDQSNATATGITDTVTTVADNCWVVGASAGAGGGTMNAGTGVTIRAQQTAEPFGMGDSNSAKTPAGSYSMTFNRSTGTDSVGIVMASFAASVDAAFIPKANWFL